MHLVDFIFFTILSMCVLMQASDDEILTYIYGFWKAIVSMKKNQGPLRCEQQEREIVFRN